MPGNLPNYNQKDIVRALFLIANSPEPIARVDLMDGLGLGEGTVRTVLDLLKLKKLIISTNQGHKLTSGGEDIITKITKKLINLNTKKIKLEIEDYKKLKHSIMVLRLNKQPDYSFKFRDIAIKNNADAAMILYYDGKLCFPDSNYKKEHYEPFKIIEENFQFEEGDVLIITFAQTQRDAENSGLAVVEGIDGKLLSLG
ncbi:DUF4443 domain-containing protein [Nanoarchaeota archaeon]